MDSAMSEFDRWLAQGQRLGLSEEKLIEYVNNCEEKAIRQKEREEEKEKIRREKIEAEERQARIEEGQRLFEIKKLEKEKEYELEQKNIEIKKLEKEKEYELEQKKIENEREREERQARIEELEKEKEYELEQKKIENEREREERAHELTLKQMEIDSKAKVSLNDDSGVEGKKIPYIPKLPPFDENRDDIDSFIFRFESHAISCGWPRSKWVLYVASLFKGSALSLYHSLSMKQDIQWDDLKTELLKKFQCTEEGFREKFRAIRPEKSESFAGFFIRSGHLLDRWIELATINKSFDDLRDLVLREQLLQSVSRDLSIFLKERSFENAEEMCKIADQYCAAHPEKTFARRMDSKIFDANVSQTQLSDTFRRGPQFQGTGKFSGGGRNFNHSFKQLPPRENGPIKKVYPQTRSTRIGGGAQGYNYSTRFQVHCYNCDCKYHKKNECPYLQKERAPTSRVEQHVLVSENSLSSLNIEHCTVNGYEASLLRDTGCTTAGVRRSLVKTDQYTGETQNCRSFGGHIETFLLAQVKVDTPYYCGDVLACVIENPVADLILGNLPGVKSVCGGNVGSFVPLANVSTRAQVIREGKPAQPLKTPKLQELKVTPKMLSDLQKKDETLKSIYKNTVQIDMEKSEKPYFKEEDDILYRVLHKDGEVTKQIVVPRELRETVLHTAHNCIMSAHCGTKRTLKRVLSNFYWPGVTKSVSQFCQTCDLCQRSLPKGRVPCAPLQQMPVIEEPFSRIAIDLVGPIKPVSASGYRYILTVVDVATRYPEAIPLKKIDAITVAEALFSVFTRMGCPKEILSDCGSQFISELMKELYRLMSIESVTTTPYHPQSNGMVERFNGTLKAMLRKVIQQRPTDWDRYLPALLFAYRELPNDSTGFSPFELMFGRFARGPVSILAETWSRQNKTKEKPVFEYVFDLQNKMAETCKLAQKQLNLSAKKYKAYADKKAKMREFKSKQKVLVLLSAETGKLLTQWKGPYEVRKKIGKVNYLIDVNGNEKIFHVNMLKLYNERQSPILVNANVGVSENEYENNDAMSDLSDILPIDCVTYYVSGPQCCGLDTKEHRANVGIVSNVDEAGLSLPTVPTIQRETVKDVKIDHSLTEQQALELQFIFEDFLDVLTDQPGTIESIIHRIRLTTDKPVHVKPYPLPFAKREQIEREVKVMLDMGVIEPSDSPYSSPVVLVNKPDGSVRFCVDYRQLNKITVSDAEPIPNIDELFCKLVDANYFVKIDLTKGYWQIPVHKDDRQKTAFQTPLGLFQWTKMPFGLKNAPATFQRMMSSLCLIENSAVSFFDDILIATQTWSSLLISLRGVLQKLLFFNLTARPSKIFAGFKELNFLGHFLSDGCIKPDKNKIEKILSIATPKTKKQVRAVLGLLSYYRRYVPHFAELTAPLTDITKGTRRSSIIWTSECQTALTAVQKCLTSGPILKLPNLCKDFILRTDASSAGMGAVLLQYHDTLLHPVMFASKKFTEVQTRYSTIERECLAVIWAFEKFARYLVGRRFVLQTDHRPLTFLQSSKSKNNRLLRWALAIQEYDFEVDPIPGTQNAFADLLSRS